MWRGDLVIVSKAELAADKLLLTAYTIVPDENRSGTRLTGAAEVTLGAEPKFNAVISGGDDGAAAARCDGRGRGSRPTSWCGC